MKCDSLKLTELSDFDVLINCVRQEKGNLRISQELSLLKQIVIACSTSDTSHINQGMRAEDRVSEASHA